MDRFDTYAITVPAEGGLKGIWKLESPPPISLRKLGESGLWRRLGSTSAGNSAKHLCCLCRPGKAVKRRRTCSCKKSTPVTHCPATIKKQVPTLADPCARGWTPTNSPRNPSSLTYPIIQKSKIHPPFLPRTQSHPVKPKKMVGRDPSKPKPETRPVRSSFSEGGNSKLTVFKQNSRCAPWNCLSNPPEHRIGIPRRCVNEAGLSIVISRNKLTGLGIVWII
jgi:hypothetical protein